MTEIKRPLCIANDNTCPNVAALKDHRNGKPRYRKLCESHRRHKRHGTFADPKSRRFVPLNKCDMCTGEAEERHRVIQGSEYGPETVVTLCRNCHKKIHNFYDVIKAKGFAIVKS